VESDSDELSSKDTVAGNKQTKSVMGIENFVRGAHKRDEYEMPNNFMTDVREILVYHYLIVVKI
jgi:hypothetical protein